MAGALVLAVAGFEVVAVVGGVGHDRVVQQVHAAQRVEQPAEPFVQAFDLTQVAAHVPVRGAAERGQVRRHPAALVALLVAVGGRVVVRLVLVVRLQQRQEEEERLGGMISVVGDEPHGRVEQRVGAVAG